MAENKKKYIGAIDQGTTSTRFILFNYKGEIAGSHQLEHRQIYPKPGWVEHDPLEIWKCTIEVIQTALKKTGITPLEIASIGITNQRETTVVWNKKTGKPYYNAIVWQDTRTAGIIKGLSDQGDEKLFRNKTGLPLATYFSGPKIKWILDNVDGTRHAARSGDAIFGTIDTWLIWQLTGGVNGGRHITDVTNAGRTMLMDIQTLSWDDKLLDILDIPKSIMPEIRPSIDYSLYGYTTNEGPFGMKIPIGGALGDQQAALFGQTCYNPGDLKNTYGTGCFLLVNTGKKIIHSKHGLITTPAYKIGDKPAVYAIEGSIAVAGALVRWFRDKIGLIKESREIEELANSVADNGGVYFAPAFSGLYAPYWKSNARGAILGLTGFNNKGHIARAILEATAYQTKEIFDAIQRDSQICIQSMKVDGGMVVNNTLMQFQSDILNIPVICPKVIETTALGAAYAAGLAVGFYNDLDELKLNWAEDKRWLPRMEEGEREKLYHFWKKAVTRTFDWVE